jgi:hypothetical protein
VNKLITLIAVLAIVIVMTSAIKSEIDPGRTNGIANSANYDGALSGPVKDSTTSVKAFMDVYRVLMSPRCMNCHPSGDVPLQGDDSHLHTMLPKRGKEGKGLYAMKCSNCHQPTNIAGLHKPPGNPNWHLPPASMKMVFQGRSPYQLAKQLMNPKTNGNKTIAQLIAHADDGLVKAGWNMGEGRTLPPLSHAEFKKAWLTWINNGAYAPKP